MNVKFGADCSRFMVQKEPTNSLKRAFYLIVTGKCEKMRPVLRRRCNFQGCGTQGHRSPSNSLWSNSFWGPDFFGGCFILQGLQFHGFQSLKGKWAIPSTLDLLSPGTSTLVRYYYHQHKWWCSFLKQVHLTKKMQKRCKRIAQSTHKPSTHKQMCAKFFWETAISLTRSRQRHLCQPIQPHSPTPSKASPLILSS